MSQFDRLLDRAKAGDPTAAAELWQAIASGEADNAVVLAWARDVAGQVVAKVLNPNIEANRRPDAALKAIGFEGQRERHRAVRDLLDVLNDFENLEEPGRKATRAELMHFVRAHGFLNDVGDEAAKKVLDRLRAK